MPEDKKKHLIFGFIVTIIFGLFCGAFWGLLVGVSCGIFKEIVDSMGYGTPELLDFLYTAVGSGFAYLLLILLTGGIL